jgi:type IV secretory pathway VirB6-like protein
MDETRPKYLGLANTGMIGHFYHCCFHSAKLSGNSKYSHPLFQNILYCSSLHLRGFLQAANRRACHFMGSDLKV